MSVGNFVRSRVRVRIRVRVKIFLGPYDSLFDSEGVFRRPERWGFGKYGHCQIGCPRKKLTFSFSIHTAAALKLKSTFYGFVLRSTLSLSLRVWWMVGVEQSSTF